MLNKEFMASHDSAKKSVRKTLRQRAVNVSRMSRIKTYIKKVEEAITAKVEKSSIVASFSNAQKEIMKGASKNIFHKNTASRKISKLAKKVKNAIGDNQ